MKVATWTPKCPNHGVALVDLNPKEGIGICPVSSCHFRYDPSSTEKSVKEIKRYKMTVRNGEYVKKLLPGDKVKITHKDGKVH